MFGNLSTLKLECLRDGNLRKKRYYDSRSTVAPKSKMRVFSECQYLVDHTKFPYLYEGVMSTRLKKITNKLFSYISYSRSSSASAIISAASLSYSQTSDVSSRSSSISAITSSRSLSSSPCVSVSLRAFEPTNCPSLFIISPL